MRHPVQGVLAGTARAAGSAVFAAAIFSPVCAKADTILWVDDSSGNIGQVDINTQSVVAGSVHSTGLSLTDIAFGSTGTLYGTTWTGLYSINQSTGAATSLGSYSDGELFNALVGSSGPDLLGAGQFTAKVYSINPSSPGNPPVFSSSPGAADGDLAFSGSKLYEVINPFAPATLADVTDGTVVGLLHTGAATYGSVFGLADDGTTMYAVDGTEVFSVDLANAAMTPLFDYSLNENGQHLGAGFGSAFINEGSSGPPPSVPEPTSFALLGTGLFSLVFSRRRALARKEKQMQCRNRGLAGPAARRVCGSLFAVALLAMIALSPEPAKALPAGSPDAKLYSDAGLAVGLMSGAIGSCAFVPSCLALLRSGGATLGDVAIVGFATFALGTVLDHLAADPIDLNYMTVAPVVPGIPPSLSPSAPASLVNLVDTETDGIGLANAMITAFNRAEGAFVSAAPSFVSLQLSAFNTFGGQLTSDLLSIGTDYNDYISDFGPLFSTLFGTFGDQLIADGDGLVPATPANVMQAASGSTSVPEPSSIAVYLSGLLLLMILVGGRIPWSRRHVWLATPMK
jgi:hypothetical protein